ncbi:MAG: protein kinase, partial [Planctomycetota bacterium]
MNQPKADLNALIGTVRAGFRIERLLGAGGMGAVYEADGSAHGWPKVALKVLAPTMAHDEKLRHRFVREGRTQQSIVHDNIVPVFDAGEGDGIAWIAMEYTSRGSLGALLRHSKQLAEHDARPIFEQILAG